MQNQDVIVELKNEIARLRSDLEYLNGMCKLDAEDTTDHIKYIYKYLKMLDDRSIADLKLLVEYLVVIQDSISPLEEKLFPGVSKARQQLAAIRENLRQAEQRKNDK